MCWILKALKDEYVYILLYIYMVLIVCLLIYVEINKRCDFRVGSWILCVGF